MLLNEDNEQGACSEAMRWKRTRITTRIKLLRIAFQATWYKLEIKQGGGKHENNPQKAVTLA